jgi:hypothetical protein
VHLQRAAQQVQMCSGKGVKNIAKQHVLTPVFAMFFTRLRTRICLHQRVIFTGAYTHLTVPSVARI